MRDTIHPFGPAALTLLGLAQAMPVLAAETPPDLLLAREARPGHSPAGYLVSEKFDGVRALWDGHRLRLRGGGEVKAPAWFLAGLPVQAVDGELWLGRGRFDELSALVRREQPVDAEWREVRYMVFELPGAPGSFAQRAAALRVFWHRSGIRPCKRWTNTAWATPRPWRSAWPRWWARGARAWCCTVPMRPM